MDTMTTITVTILGINGTLIGALVWFLKFIITKLFGNGNRKGLLPDFLESFRGMHGDIRENTQAIRDLQQTQDAANETLLEILQHQKQL
jgi:hypothetical protein